MQENTKPYKPTEMVEQWIANMGTFELFANSFVCAKNYMSLSKDIFADIFFIKDIFLT